MGRSEKLALLNKANGPQRMRASGWRVMQIYEESKKGRVGKKVFVLNLQKPTDKPVARADQIESQFSAYWDAKNKRWLLEKPNN